MRDDEPEHNQGVGDNYDTMEDERDALQSRLDAAEKENAELESALDALRQQLTNAIDERNIARKESTALAEQLAAAYDSRQAMIRENAEQVSTAHRLKNEAVARAEQAEKEIQDARNLWNVAPGEYHGGWIEQMQDTLNQLHDALTQVEALKAQAQEKRWEHPRDLSKSEGWWCTNCKIIVPGTMVTYQERHDSRYGGCGEIVLPERPDEP